MEWIFAFLVILSSFADMVTTEYALMNPSIHEMNPLMQNTKLRISTKIITPIIFHYTFRELERQKKIKRWHRVVVIIGASSIWGYCAYRNNEIYKRGQQ